MTQYERGRRKEWDAVARLRAQGYLASRSAGSHGLWDVVAVKPGKHGEPVVRLIQVKYTKLRGTAWQDDNWRLLRAMFFPMPVSVEAWVYRFGTKLPQVWIATPEGETLLAAD